VCDNCWCRKLRACTVNPGFAVCMSCMDAWSACAPAKSRFSPPPHVGKLRIRPQCQDDASPPPPPPAPAVPVAPVMPTVSVPVQAPAAAPSTSPLAPLLEPLAPLLQPLLAPQVTPDVTPVVADSPPPQ
jgi:hypothetical protein